MFSFFALRAIAGNEHTISYDKATQTLSIDATSAYTRSDIEGVVGSEPVKTIKIQGSYNEIPEAAFAFLDVESVIISSTIKKINDMAFFGCKKLTGFSAPNGCEYIGNECFRDCASLQAFYYRKCTMTFMANVFQGCKKLEVFAQVNGDQSSPVAGVQRTFGPGVFKDLTSLKTVTLLDDTAVLGKSMFENTVCDIKIPSGVTRIPDSCFRNSKITEADLSNVVVVGIRAFHKCMSLKSVKFGTDKIRLIMAYAFQCCCNAVITGLDDADYLFEMYAFSCIQTLKTFTMPLNMYSVPAGAFLDCHNLEKVVYNSHIFQIWERAFMNTKISEAHIPKRTDWVAPGGFAGLPNCKKFVIEEGNTKLATDLDGKVLTKPDKLTLISYLAGNEPEVVTVADTYFLIRSYAFAGSKITGFKLQSGTTGICQNAFAQCPNLVNVEISDFLTFTTIGLFKECENLETITLPAVTRIADYTFAGCKKLKTLNIPNLQIIEDHAFDGCTSLSGDFTGFESLASIEAHAFSGCSFDTLKLPASVTYIEHDAFSNIASLKAAFFSGKNTKYDSCIFRGDDNLLKVVFYDNIASIESDTFDGTKNLGTIVYCGNHSPQPLGVKIVHTPSLYVFTTTAYTGRTWAGINVFKKMTNCDVSPVTPTPAPPTPIPPTPFSPTPIPPTPVSPTAGPDNSKTKQIIIGSVCGCLGFIVVAVCVFFCFCRKPNKGELMNSTPLISTN